MELVVLGRAVQQQSRFPSWCQDVMCSETRCPCPLAKPTPAPPGHVFLDPNAEFFPAYIASGAAAQPGSGGAQGALPRQGQQRVWPSLQSLRDLKLKPVPSPFLLPVKFLLSRC